MRKPQDFSALTSSENFFIDELYTKFKNNPSNEELSEDWKNFFQGFDFAVLKGMHLDEDSLAPENSSLEKEFKIFKLVQAYRSRAHLISKTNPIRERRDRAPKLQLSDFGLKEADLDYKTFCGIELGLGIVSLAEVLEHLKKIYCESIGYEFMHINNSEIREWFREKVEIQKGEFHFSIEKKKRILQKLNEASVFENFLDTKYVGQKRFSLEGGENTISALDSMINKASELEVHEVIIGMAHRGRLNVLANILGKTYEYIFTEFEGNARPDLSFGDGDVKYHQGFSSEVKTSSGQNIYLKLMPNPSHLEAVGPVVLGFARAQADQLYQENYSKVLPIIIHGDAAVAGQGIVYESIQLSELKGYKTGGTIHFVINNQIGFTTDFGDARSSAYSTSVARTLDIPIIHVNGDDAEAVVHVVELAVEFRQKFKKDIFIDMVCYRKHGHNESDEPRFTQPRMYELIKNHASPREVYIDKLIHGKAIEIELAHKMEQEFKNLLQDRFNQVKQKPLPYYYQKPEKEWGQMRAAKAEDFFYSPPTGVKKAVLEKIYQGLITLPSDIKPINKAIKLLEDRKNKWQANTLDWAMCELLAYGSLMHEGYGVRLSGQDCIRGTFSHRHAEIFDVSGTTSYNGLNAIPELTGKFKVYNSLLSEYAVLAFEFGYSISSPKSLVIWEAQFGDFSNGAQTVFDQFISSGESKWQKMSGLVCYLPHGYEGQGPEHSSARLERFLQLSAESNMIVANVTQPANLFHLLRRQLRWNFRKPLILMTPKSLLRHPECVSSVAELESGEFREVIYDASIKNKKEIKKVLWSSGKISYDLLKYQKEQKRKDVLIVRIEQLYPMPLPQIQKVLKDFAHASMVWVQEEPKNMGAWTFLHRYPEFKDFSLISRKSSASPATGFAAVHTEEQNNIITKAFEI
jgi:2-oxoglutarate dehydrogenase E1 component